MNKTILKLGISALLLSTSTLFGAPNSNEVQNPSNKQHKMQGKKHHGMHKLLKQLALTQDQEERIKGYKKSMRQQMKDIHKSSSRIVAFHPTYFDKSLFISQARNMFEKKIHIRADFMENIYNTLTPVQKLKMIEVMKGRGNRK